MELRVCSRCEQVLPGATLCPGCGGPLTVAAPDFFVGKHFGKYTVEEVLGVGGMGVVYLAEQRTLLRKVALKLVLPEHDDTVFRRRFLREARVLAELHHPNIVEVYDFDVNEWGLPFYVMEYLQGETLRDFLNRRTRLTPGEILPILREVAAGLGSVHRREVVHRDLKPENIFLADFDGVRVTKVLDFGIAKGGGPGTETRLTGTGLVVGTVNYLAPEQLLETSIGPPVDQYALALVIIELLTGRAVRAGKTVARIIGEEIQAPVDIRPLVDLGIHPALAETIQRATAPEPADRFPDVETFIEDVAQAVETHSDSDVGLTVASSGAGRLDPTVAARPRPAGTGSPPTRNSAFPIRRIAAVIGIAAIIATATILVRGWSDRPASSNTGEVLELEREIPVPLDTVDLIGQRDSLLTMAGMDGLIFLDTDSDRSPTRVNIPLPDILGMTPEGMLLIRDGNQIIFRDTEQGDGTPWGRGLPIDEKILAAPDTRHIVSLTENTLTVWKLADRLFSPAFTVGLDSEPRVIKVGTRFLAVATENDLQVWSLDREEPVYDEPLPETSVSEIAVDDDAALVAVGGWFDSVIVVDLADHSTNRVHRRQGATMQVALRFLPAGATLVIGERGGITLWRPGSDAVPTWNRETADITALGWSSGRLLALDRENHTVLVFSIGGIASRKVIEFADDSAWTALADPTSERVLVGSQSGILHAINLSEGSTTDFTIHTQGITSLVTDGTRLASASDDRTIAVWRLPELTVEWRSRAHGFLVNQLFLDREHEMLWSTSSDHNLKRWTWPELNEVETIRTEDVIGEALSLGALWIDPTGNRAFLGTWNRKALLLERTPEGELKGQTFPFDSFGGYAIGDLRPLDALFLLGVQHPFGMSIFDLKNSLLLPLRGSNREVSCMVTMGGGRRVLAFGNHEILDYRFRRADDGTLHYRMAITLHHDLGTASASTLVSDDLIAVANDQGILHVIAIEDIDGAEVCDVAAGE